MKFDRKHDLPLGNDLVGIANLMLRIAVGLASVGVVGFDNKVIQYLLIAALEVFLNDWDVSFSV